MNTTTKTVPRSARSAAPRDLHAELRQARARREARDRRHRLRADLAVARELGDRDAERAACAALDDLFIAAAWQRTADPELRRLRAAEAAAVEAQTAGASTPEVVNDRDQTAAEAREILSRRPMLAAREAVQAARSRLEQP